MNFKLKIVATLIRVKITKALYLNGMSFVKKRRMRAFLQSLKQSPFYNDLGPDFTTFPIIDKSVFMSEFDRINTCGITSGEAFRVALEAENSRDFAPMIGDVTVGLSTGTSGNRGLFLANESERAVWVALILDRVIGFSLHKRKVAFFLRANSNLYQSTQSKLLQFHFFDLFKDFDEHIAELNSLQPDIVVAQPSMLTMLAAEKESGRLQINPSKVISVAEVLSPEDKQYLSGVFDQVIHQVYQCTEGFLAATCEYGTLHFNEDFLMIEKKYIDEEKTKFHPVITDLWRTSQPIVRYELNDIITEKHNCECGSPFLAIEQIEGRSDDILLFQSVAGIDVKLFPDLFRRTIVLADEHITDYCLIQRSAIELDLYLESSNQDSFSKAVSAIEQLLATYKVVDIKINPITQNPFVPGTKKRRVRNESRKAN